MDHVAIMRKSWGMLPKILSGEKMIESRWLKNRSAPWGRIKMGDVVYFKETGLPVALCATVKSVDSHANLYPQLVRTLLEKHHKELGILKDDLEEFYRRMKNSRYVLFIFLKDVKATEPFEIDKTGFGAMSAWICVEDISIIRRYEDI